MIAADNLTIHLGGRKVVDGVSFSAQPGAVTAIIGPNGSGKTTTMRALSGEQRYEGHITFSGRDIRTMSSREMALERGVLQQSVSLGFPFKVREILEMGVVAGDTHSAEQAERVMARALEAVDLSGFENRVATALSGGEQSRMHMARVLCQIAEPVQNGKPCWLFLDEPVASLDVRHQLAIMALARSFAKRGGGVIAVMHDLNLTAMFADTVVMLREGRLHAAGAPAEVLTAEHLAEVYGCALDVARDPVSGRIRILPPDIAA